MGRLTFTLDTDDFSSGCEDIKQLAEDIQAFINILHHTSPDYIEAGNILQAQLDEQMKEYKPVDPKKQMYMEWDKIFDEAGLGFAAWDLHERHGDEPCPGYWDAWDNFYHQIGEAMGPVCYAGYKLKMKFIEAGQYADWVDACIDYYEKNWKF